MVRRHPPGVGTSLGGRVFHGPIHALKPMLLFDGETDPLFTAAGVSAAYAKMRAVWASQRSESRLRIKTWPGLGHVFVQEMQDEAFTWRDAWLSGTRLG